MSESTIKIHSRSRCSHWDSFDDYWLTCIYCDIMRWLDLRRQDLQSHHDPFHRQGKKEPGPKRVPRWSLLGNFRGKIHFWYWTSRQPSFTVSQQVVATKKQLASCPECWLLNAESLFQGMPRWWQEFHGMLVLIKKILQLGWLPRELCFAPDQMHQ